MFAFQMAMQNNLLSIEEKIGMIWSAGKITDVFCHSSSLLQQRIEEKIPKWFSLLKVGCVHTSCRQGSVGQQPLRGSGLLGVQE